MKRNYINLILTVATLLGLASCQNFLDVKPEDQMLEETVYSNRQSVNLALNGLYIKIAGANLYGENLTLSTVEVLGQRYNLSSLNGAFYSISQYSWAEGAATGRTGNIWTEGYSSIMQINKFLQNLDARPGLLDAKTDSIYRGEVIAMRAMLHFDLLRLFGPRYSTADSTQISIPYYDKVENVARPLLPANEVMKNIVADLNQAEKLLEKDPVITKGVMSTTTSTDLMVNRNYRFNYFAVKALQGRVNLYRGDKAIALAAAKVVIDNAPKFPWTTLANSNEVSNPDRVFSTEMILGAYTNSLYSEHNLLFNETLEENQILVPTDKILKSVFEIGDTGAGIGGNDYRYRLNWAQPSGVSNKPYRTFNKYADVAKKTMGFRNTIPLLKLSEMYYIAAECEPNQNQALAYLNTVRTNRGLDVLTTVPNLQNEILKEYKKEFFGEGQLFFYYKRTNTASIASGVDGAPVITMDASKYVAPLPDSESQFH